ncbi:MAG TPA: SGNH/GDSL hydrolase family protein [Patescibacteria group bacterium]|nr:SGNH/GDSL hydrolase family protein [Patescibacteria group bacterium]
MKPLQIFLLILIIYILLQAAYSAYYFHKSRALVKNSHVGSFEVGNKGPTYLFFAAGDSVGAGIGASTFETSLVGRLSAELAKDHKVEVNNKSVSGYRMLNLVDGPLPSKKQDLILLVISSNDVFNFTNLDRFKDQTHKVFDKYSKLADKVVVIGPGRIFDTDALPLFMRLIYKQTGKKYASVMAEEASKYPNIIYVNPYEASEIGKEYGDTGAADKFHPNDEGYRFWFDLVMNKFNK